MGMPATVEIIDAGDHQNVLDEVYLFWSEIDEQFSTYKETSEVSQINAGALSLKDASKRLRHILTIAEQTKQETKGYFDVQQPPNLDPSGIVKGWAIQEAANLLQEANCQNYYVEIAGDLQVAGYNSSKAPWTIGIRNPFNHAEVIKVLRLSNCGIATSGSAARGQHIYNPLQPSAPLSEIVSVTVIAPSVLDADRFATAAFAMQEDAMQFIASLPELEGYMINKDGLATYTPGFTRYL